MGVWTMTSPTASAAFEAWYKEHGEIANQPGYGFDAVKRAFLAGHQDGWRARGERDRTAITKTVTEALPAADSLLEACLDAIAQED